MLRSARSGASSARSWSGVKKSEGFELSSEAGCVMEVKVVEVFGECGFVLFVPDFRELKNVVDMFVKAEKEFGDEGLVRTAVACEEMPEEILEDLGVECRGDFVEFDAFDSGEYVVEADRRRDFVAHRMV